MSAFRFQSRVPVGSLTHDEMRIVTKMIGFTSFDLDKRIRGVELGRDGSHYGALKSLLRQNDGSKALRTAIHEVLLPAAEEHVSALTRFLRADLFPLDD